MRTLKPLVIFDMDGVLIDSEPIHKRLEQDIFAELGVSISAEEHDRFTGMAPRGMWSAIRERFGLEQPVAELVAAETRAKVGAFESLGLSPIAGVEDLIRSIAGQGHPLAIASSSPAALIEIVVAGLGFERYFPHRASAEQVEKGKPDPDLFLAVARRCDRSPGRCVVIEDSNNGLRAALAAGMTCIGYRNSTSGDQDLSGADLLVNDFGEREIRRIMEILEQIDARPAAGA